MRRQDRTVHARNQEVEVVRYDRAGKWYIEPRNGQRRQHVSVKEAALYALWLYENAGGVIVHGLPGGRTFERLVQHEVPTVTERAELRDLLVQVYLPDGVDTWLTARHSQFGGLTVDEMFAAGRGDEVLAVAEQLVTGAFG